MLEIGLGVLVIVGVGFYVLHRLTATPWQEDEFKNAGS